TFALHGALPIGWKCRRVETGEGTVATLSSRPRGGVVIVDDGKVALIKRVNDRGVYYLFPGGGVDEGETPADAAVREAKEELGLDVRVTGLLAVVTSRGNEQYYYAAEVTGACAERARGRSSLRLPTRRRAPTPPCRSRSTS